ncbi:MAG TPA: hypothetical protein VMU87_22810 [Stellaceae bacterium]|nr:hypothetical protein [Stellaceae bacterium]
MDDQMPFSANHFAEALDAAADALADSITGALTDAVTEAVSDPLVLTMMAADRIEPTAFEGMLRKMAAKLAGRGAAGGRLCSC